MPLHPVLEEKNLKFNSNFECGNLDAAIHVSPNEYDLFMRVDSNTKGHTNWYFFTVQNGNFVGSVRFNICNFRRDKSLYERVLLSLFRDSNLIIFLRRRASPGNRAVKT